MKRPKVTKKVPNLSDTLSEAVSVATSVAYTRQEIKKLKTELVSLLEKKTTEVIVEQVPGPVGPRGALGATGAQGPKGDKGDKGDAGDRGEKGEVGPQGNMGLDGPRGLKGDKGDKGEVGPQGKQGIQGVAGERGPQGLKGDRGEDGKTGLDGRDGEAGAIGPIGPAGPQGVQGGQGPKGDKGERGQDGQQGIQGPAGPQGIQGVPGKDGKDGDVKPVEEKFKKFQDVLEKDLQQYKNRINASVSKAMANDAWKATGSGEVNLRYLDDVDRDSIADGYVLSYDEASKKFTFVEQSGGGGGTVDTFARTRANTAWSTANSAFATANTKSYTFSQNTAPATANSNDFWANTNSGVVYYNFGNTSSPLWVEFGPTGTTTSDGSGNTDLTGYAVNTTVNLVWSTANSAYSQANTANTRAANAFTQANTANSLAQAAYNYANTITFTSTDTLDSVTDRGNTTNNSISVLSVNIPVGSLLSGSDSIIASILNESLNAVLEYGNTANLVIGNYGLTNGITGVPYVVYQLKNTPTISLQVGDIVGGASVPSNSAILAVGTGANSNVIITNTNFAPGASLPIANTVLTFARQITNAGLSISTNANTDITLNPGAGGYIVPHSDIIPYTTNIWSIGTPAKRFKELWLGAGTIYVQDETLGNDQALGAKDGNFYIKGGAGLEVGEFTLLDNQIKIANNARDMIVGTIGATANVVFNRSLVVQTNESRESFNVTRDGLVKIFTPTTLLTSQSALEIVGTSNGQSRARNFTGTLLQLTAQDNAASRISMDSFGNSAANSYAVIAGRQARGTVSSPTATQANDTIFRLSSQGWGTTGYVPSIGRINIQATQNFTDSAAGTRVRFQLTPTNSNVIQTTSADIDSTGLSFVGNSDGGITFRDGTRQITAANNIDQYARSTANSAWTTANTQSDWNVSDNTSVAFIKNKPTLVTTLNDLSDATIVSPLNEQVLVYNTATGQWINQAIGISANNLTTGYFGSFFYSGANVALSNTSLAYTVPVTGSYSGTNGVTIGGNNDIVIAYAGTYHIEYSIQLENAGNSDDDVDVWVRVNGVNVANSGSKFSVNRKNNANDPGSLIAVTPFMLTLNAADRVQFEVASSAGQTKIASYPTQINPTTPAIPAVIVNVNQVSSIVIPNDIAGTANNASNLGGFSANSYIRLSTLKSVVASSTSFADFQTRIANL